MTAPRLTLRMREVAEQTGVSVGTVRNWTASGQLTSVRVGGVVLVKPDDLDAFLEAHREGNHIARPARLRTVKRAGTAGAA